MFLSKKPGCMSEKMRHSSEEVRHSSEEMRHSSEEMRYSSEEMRYSSEEMRKISGRWGTFRKCRCTFQKSEFLPDGYSFNKEIEKSSWRGHSLSKEIEKPSWRGHTSRKEIEFFKEREVLIKNWIASVFTKGIPD